MKNVMRECSNVVRDVFLTTIAGALAIATVTASALADRVHVMENVVLATIFVAIVAGNSFALSSKIIVPFQDPIASKILIETAMEDAFTKLSNVTANVQMGLGVVAASVFLQIAGTLKTIEVVLISALTITTNAMETALMDTQHVEAIAAYRILPLRITSHVAKAVCTKQPGQPFVLNHVGIGVFIGEILVLPSLHTLTRYIGTKLNTKIVLITTSGCSESYKYSLRINS